jgi:cob(I)alamin adenosyltransferase
MKICTGFGDEGRSRRIDGTVVSKADLRIQAGGELDELNAHLGACLHKTADAGIDEVAAWLAPVQAELLAAGALVAAAGTTCDVHLQLEPTSIRRMEQQIDETWRRLPALEHFVLPGGSEPACWLHVGRTVCRRAERTVAALAAETDVPPIILRYLNRLGDLLFALARLANHKLGVEEVLWQGPDST